ncbi:MAG: hypothetical protein Q8Q40_05070 [Methylococcaceae bacterium]|nr:hypothetical protein [Methylococcaceae bacterium]MDP3903326.1 hypothetical protein [Methylococcaceae bacterium]
MITTLFVQLGFILLTLGCLALLYRIVQFVLIIFFGKNINITYVDKKGVKQTKRIRVNHDDELVKLIAEIKVNAKNASDVLK